jgi:hypothetical protein
MLKTHIAACLAAGLVAAPAVAQVQTDQPPAANDTMQPRPLEGAPDEAEGTGASQPGAPAADSAQQPMDAQAGVAAQAGETFARDIDEIRVNMTREQLDAAPEFARLERPAPAVDQPLTAPGMGGGMGGGMGVPPPGRPQ